MGHSESNVNEYGLDLDLPTNGSILTVPGTVSNLSLQTDTSIGVMNTAIASDSIHMSSSNSGLNLPSMELPIHHRADNISTIRQETTINLSTTDRPILNVPMDRLNVNFSYNESNKHDL